MNKRLKKLKVLIDCIVGEILYKNLLVSHIIFSWFNWIRNITYDMLGFFQKNTVLTFWKWWIIDHHLHCTTLGAATVINLRASEQYFCSKLLSTFCSGTAQFYIIKLMVLVKYRSEDGSGF